MNEYEILKREVEELKAWKRSLEMSNFIPLSIEQSLRARFSMFVSEKSATSENRAVDEGGGLQYNVLTNPDLFLKITIEGVTYDVPAFKRT